MSKHITPDEGIKDLLFINDNGLLEYVDRPENKRRFSKNPSGIVGAKVTGGVRKGNPPTFRYNGIEYRAHHLMYWFKTGKYPDSLDFIDNDCLNYRFENLRELDRNGFMKVMNDTNYGISTYKLKDGTVRYRAKVSFGSKNFYLGTYDSELEAIKRSWLIRELLFPGIVPLHPKLKELFTDEDSYK